MYLGISLVTGRRQEGVVHRHFTDLLVLFSGHSTIDPSSKLTIRVVTTTFTTTDGVFQRTRAVCRPNPFSLTSQVSLSLLMTESAEDSYRHPAGVYTQDPALILKSTACGSRRARTGNGQNQLPDDNHKYPAQQYCRNKNWPKRDSLHTTSRKRCSGSKTQKPRKVERNGHKIKQACSMFMRYI